MGAPFIMKNQCVGMFASRKDSALFSFGSAVEARVGRCERATVDSGLFGGVLMCGELPLAVYAKELRQ